MATLQKIRNRSALLIGIVGLALLSFVASDPLQFFQSQANASRQYVGEIYGKPIKIQEFEQYYNEVLNAVTMGQNIQSLTDQQMAQLRDEAWQLFITNKLIEQETQKLGLTVTDEELKAEIREGKNEVLARTPFTGANGRFDYGALQQFLLQYEQMTANPTPEMASYIEGYTKLYNYWLFLEKDLKRNLLYQKYFSLLDNSFVPNPVSAKAYYDGRVAQSKLLVAALPYRSIPDSTIQISNSDMKAKYEEMKNRFESQAETRDYKYISVRVTPSTEDRAALEDEMDEYAEKLATTTEINRVVRDSKSMRPYVNLALSKNYFDTDISQRLDTMEVGEQSVPYFNYRDNTYNIVRLLGKENTPDSIQFRTIVIAGYDAAAMKKTTDSIYTALNNGAIFDSVAVKYGQSGQKNWFTSRQYEQGPLTGEELKLIKSILAIPTNKTEIVETANGNYIIQVLDRRAMSAKYNAAVIKRQFTFSNETYEKAYNAFSNFVAGNPTAAQLIANADSCGYSVVDQKNMPNTIYNVAQLDGTRDAVRWIFNENTEVGDISPLYECGSKDAMLVVTLTGIHPKGFASLEDVNDLIRMEVLKDKKAAILSEKLAGIKDPKDAASIEGATVDSLSNVTFNANAYVPFMSTSEPVLSGVAATLEPNQVSAPVKGMSGVYLVKQLGQTYSNEKYDKNKEEEASADRYANMARASFIRDLLKKADVQDNRYLFY